MGSAWYDLSAVEHPTIGRGVARQASESMAPGQWHGLVGAWAPFLGHQGGVLYDSSGYGRMGTITGPLWKASTRGPALLFNGSTDFVTIADHDVFSIVTTNVFTVTAWVNASGGGTIVNKGDGNYEWDLFIGDGSSNLKAVCYTTAGTNVLETQVGFPSLGIWHHVAFTVNAASPSLRLYLNGVLSAEDTTAGGALGNTTSVMRIGQRADTSASLAGLIDDVRIYNRVLSPPEMMAMVTHPFAMYQLRQIYAFSAGARPLVIAMSEALGIGDTSDTPF